MNNIQKVDFLNVILVIVAAVLAVLFPLHTFILSFAILGPLHYLTEINWLNKKGIVTPANKSLWVVSSLLISFFIVFPHILVFASPNLVTNPILIFINTWNNLLLFLGFILSIAFLYSSKKNILIISVISIVIGLITNNFPLFAIIFGTLTPTIIHVYFFTLLFMWHGAKLSKERTGYYPLILATLFPILLWIFPIEPRNYFFEPFWKSVYVDNQLYKFPQNFSYLIGNTDFSTFYFYNTLELKLMIFVAFSYLYHYLNWFSKTSIIKWNENLNSKNWIVIFCIWGAILAAYYMDFKLGFVLSIFFSYLHVIMEFPLNIKSIKIIFTTI